MTDSAASLLSIKDIGIVVFTGIERLDFEGPLAVLGWASRILGGSFRFHFLSKDGQPVRDHLVDRMIGVDGSTTQFKGFDLLIVPGGDLAQFGNDGGLVTEIRRLGAHSSMVASVCTGAFLVAQTGMADGKTMTTHHMYKARFRAMFPRIKVADQARFVNDGTLWSSAGISAGIDMSLQLVIAVWGESVAKRVQSFLEYYPEPPFPP